MNTAKSSEELDGMLAAPSGNGDHEAEELRAMFTNLRENSMVASERHRAIAQRGSQLASARPVRLAWAGALAAIALLASVPLELHHRREVNAQQVQAREGALQEQQLEQSRDEALLTDVATDLSSSVAQPLEPLTVKFVSDTSSTTKGTNE